MDNSLDHHVDAIFHALGPTGKFTVLQIFVSCLGLFPGFFQLLGNIFLGFPVTHRCAQPQNESSILSNVADNTEVNISYHKCHILVTSNETVLQKTGCLYGMEYDTPVELSFVSEFDLVCDSAYLASLSQTLVIAGQGVGALTSTFISDRLGRKPVLVAANLGLLVTGGAVAFAPNYAVFAVLKFLIGVFQQSVFACFVTFILEIFVTDDRRICPVVTSSMLPLIYINLDLVAFLLRDYSWRTLALTMSSPSLVALLLWWYLEESLRWLVANGKSERITAYLKRAAKCNKKSFADIRNMVQMETALNSPKGGQTWEKDEKDKESEVIVTKATKKLSLLDVFKVRRLAINTLLLWLAWLTAAFGYFTIYMSSSKLSGNPYLNFFFISLMEPPSNFFFYNSYNRIGRRWSLIVCYIATCLGFAASGLFDSLEQNSLTSTLTIISTCIAMIGTSGAFMAVFSYTPELYPTNVRNQALGMCSLVARVGGMMGPFMGLLGEEAKWAPGLLIGCMSLLVAVLLPILPETNGLELPQTLEDLQLWFRKNNSRKYRTCPDEPGQTKENPAKLM